MYPYSDLPPNENPNNQGNYPPPYNYPPNPNNQGGYPPYSYQDRPGYYYYPPQPRPSYAYPFLRAFGIIMLVFFFLALFGYHGFFFWPLIIVGIILLANRHRWGGYYPRYNRWHSYRYQRPYYDYNQAQQPGPGYNYPPQPPTPPTSSNPETNPGWPAPKDDTKMDHPY